MNAVLLDFARGDFGNAKLSEEGAQMDAQARLVPFRPARAALSVSDDSLFFLEFLGGFAEGLFCFEEADARFAAQAGEPVFGVLLGWTSSSSLVLTLVLTRNWRPSTDAEHC